MTRESHFTPGMQAAFLDAVRKRGILGDGCKALKVSHSLVKAYRDRNPEFSAAVADAIEEGIDNLEGAAFDRAVDGKVRDIYYKGDVVGEEIVYSDSLLALLLTRRRYRETVRSEVTGADGGPLVTQEQRASRIAGLLALARGRKDVDGLA